MTPQGWPGSLRRFIGAAPWFETSSSHSATLPAVLSPIGKTETLQKFQPCQLKLAWLFSVPTVFCEPLGMIDSETCSAIAAKVLRAILFGSCIAASISAFF